MADGATATRSKRTTAAPDDPVEGMLSRLPEAQRPEGRERLEAIRHRRGCPVDVHGAGVEYTDSDGVTKTTRVELFSSRQVTKNANSNGVRQMDSPAVGTKTSPSDLIVVARCLECGEQEPSD